MAAYRTTVRQWTIAGFCLVIVLGGAFVGAFATRHDPIFSLSPPPAEGGIRGAAPADIPEARRLDLHRTFFTAWAALLLAIPALCFFPFRRSSSTLGGYWLVFWTVSLLAFVVHLYWAIFVIFDGDWSRITSSTRVSAARIDTVFAIWWAVDVLLAWLLRSENRLVTAQRAIVHLAALVLFVAGSALEGEIRLSKLLGFAMAGAVAVSLIIWVTRRLRGRTLGAAPATS